MIVARSRSLVVAALCLVAILAATSVTLVLPSLRHDLGAKMETLFEEEIVKIRGEAAAVSNSPPVQSWGCEQLAILRQIISQRVGANDVHMDSVCHNGGLYVVVYTSANGEYGVDSVKKLILLTRQQDIAYVDVYDWGEDRNIFEKRGGEMRVAGSWERIVGDILRDVELKDE